MTPPTRTRSRILCVQLADIGDLVLTTPALSALRASLPDAHIALLTTPHAAPIIGPALADEMLTFDKHTFDSPRALLQPANVGKLAQLARTLRRGRYDTVIFFHHFSTGFGVLKFVGLALASGARQRVGLQQGRRTRFLNAGVDERGFGAMHQAAYWLRLAETVTGRDAGTPPAQVHATDADHAWAAEHLPEGGPLVAVHAGSGGYSTARRWEPEKFAAVARDLMAERGAKIVFVGGPHDDTLAVLAAWGDATPPGVTDLTGQTSLGQLSAVLARCDAFIGADSGVMHIAAASGARVVAVFGPSNHRAWGPWTPGGWHEVIRSAPACSPCSYVGTGVGLRNGCAARTCMRMVEHEAVLKGALVALDGGPAWEPREREAPSHTLARVPILGVPVDKLSYDDLLAHIDRWIVPGPGRLRHICTVNPEFVMIAQGDPNFYNILNRADLCLPDGIGLILASRYLNDPIPTRVTGSDGVPAIAERAAQRGWRLYLLGAAEGIAEQAAAVLIDRYPGLQIAGTFSGSPRPEDEDAIVQRVNASRADVLLVAYGAPVQDKWIARNAPRLDVKVAMGVGGTFDYLAGIVPMAPAWMRRAGLEWLFRLVRQPWRARRQLRLPAFVWAVLRRGKAS